MLLNIVYYDQTEEAKNKAQLDALSIGSFYFSREQVCRCICIFQSVFVSHYFPLD